MPNIKINNKEYTVPDGINVLAACRQLGIEIPHFCWHPALSVVGSCRMCKVTVVQNGRARVEISCNLMVSEGLEILTETPEVKKARQMTLEFLLKSHPLDCPICDDAGECELQNYYFKYGKHDSRLEDPKVHKRKAADIGKSIVLDSERCVLCSRCVRFCGEVTKTHELGIFGMGDHEELMVVPGKRLDNDYAGNVVDLCPVGALTDKDFRFKRRVWYLKAASSICQLCSRGCNVRIDYDIDPFHNHKKYIMMKTFRTPTTEQQRIQRIKPRTNGDVNGHWICDHGRYGYKPTDTADRCLTPMMKLEGILTATDAYTAISKLASGLITAMGKGGGKVAVVVSPRLTSEEMFTVTSLFRDKLGVTSIDHRLPIPKEWYGDSILRTPDPYPNRTTAEWIGIVPAKDGIAITGLNHAIAGGKIETIVSFLADPAEYLELENLAKLKHTYLFMRNYTATTSTPDILLPLTAWGEYKGTFANYQGRIQRLTEAFEPLGESRPAWVWMNELATALKKSVKWDSYEQVETALGEAVRFYNGLTWDNIGDTGVTAGSGISKKNNIKQKVTE